MYNRRKDFSKLISKMPQKKINGMKTLNFVDYKFGKNIF